MQLIIIICIAIKYYLNFDIKILKSIKILFEAKQSFLKIELPLGIQLLKTHFYP